MADDSPEFKSRGLQSPAQDPEEGGGMKEDCRGGGRIGAHSSGFSSRASGAGTADRGPELSTGKRWRRNAGKADRRTTWPNRKQES